MIQAMDRIELVVVAFVSKLAPWLASALAMLLVVQTGIHYLGWPLYMAAIAGAAVECSGALALHTFMRLRDYNMIRHGEDPAAPMAAAWFTVLVYFASLFGIVVTGMYAAARQYMMLVIPCLSIADTVALGLASSQTHRESVAARNRAERAAEAERVQRRVDRRETRRDRDAHALELARIQAEVDAVAAHADTRALHADARASHVHATLTTAEAERAFLAHVQEHAHATLEEIAEVIGRTPSTASRMASRLQERGELERNGHGWRPLALWHDEA